MKKFSLLDGKITVVASPSGSGHLTSSLKEPREATESERSWYEYCAAVDGLESLILAHACAGVDVESEAYCKGVTDSYRAIAEKFSAAS